MIIPYTICFCTIEEEVLMLYRHKEPNKKKWNGIGGKIEETETVLESVGREVREEAGLRLDEAREVRYAGVVSWPGDEVTVDIESQGMYAFMAEFDVRHRERHRQETPEGILEWHSIDWMLDETNEAVVENVPHFLSGMLRAREPRQWHCDYRDGVLHGVCEQELKEPHFVEIT